VSHDARPSLEGRIGRFLGLATLASVGLLALGSVALLAGGGTPLDAAPGLDLGRLPADLAAFRPAGLLWLGLLAVVATPAGRVIAALAGYAAAGERAMASVAALILVVIAAGVAAGLMGA
jgi:uncharacterized membrane protein